MYQNGGQSNEPSACLGTVSGTTLTWQNPSAIQTGIDPDGSMDICYVANRNAVIAVFRNANSGIRLERGTVSGTTLTWDQPTNSTSGDASGLEYLHCCYNSSNNNIAVFYKGGGNNPYMSEWTMASGGSITLNGVTHYDGANGNWTNVTYDSGSNGYVTVNTDTGNSNKGAIRFGLSGGAGAPASPSTKQYFTTSAAYYNELAYDPDTNQTIIVWKDADSTVKACTAAWSGSAWSFGTTVQITSETLQSSGISLDICYDSNIKKFIVTWSTASNLYVRSGSVVGTSLVLDPQTIVSSGESDFATCVVDTTNNKTILSYGDSTQSDTGKGRVMTVGYSNMSADTYIGLSNNTVTNGQTVKVNTASNISTQSGLTTASKYYVQGVTGSVGTTADSISFMAGIALNSTQLLIKSA